jgi:hypothetical protein
MKHFLHPTFGRELKTGRDLTRNGSDLFLIIDTAPRIFADHKRLMCYQTSEMIMNGDQEEAVALLYLRALIQHFAC